jgi:hypothetical protein
MSGSRRRPGRLGSCVGGYRAWLLELGYSPSGVTPLAWGVGPLGPVDGQPRHRRRAAQRRGVESVVFAGLLSRHAAWLRK